MRLGLGISMFTQSSPPPSEGGGGEPEIPDGAVARLGYADGYYYADGSTRAVGDLLAGGFDPSAVSASGMLMTDANANRPIASALLLPYFQGSYTHVLTLTDARTVTGQSLGVIAQFYTHAVPGDADNGLSVYITGTPDFIMVDYGDIDIQTSEATVNADALNKVAFMTNKDVGGGNFRFAHSINGMTLAQVDAPASVAGWLRAQIGWDDDNLSGTLGGYIVDHVIYPTAVKDEDDLATLTT